MNASLNIQTTINRDYWMQKLRSEPLQYNFANAAALDGIQRADFSYSLDNQALKQIKSQYAKSDLAFFTFALSALQVLFYRYSGNSEQFAATSSFQPNDESPTDACYFIKCQMEASQTYLEVLKQVKEDVLQAHKHRDTEPDAHVTLLEDPDKLAYRQLSFIYTKLQKSIPKNIRFGIEFTLEENGMLQINYNPDFIDESLVNTIAQHYNEILKQVSTGIEIKLSEINFLLKDEKELILQHFNANQTDYPADKSLSQLFEEQVKSSPNTTALVFENEHYTYAELNAKANQLAAVLVQKGTKVDQPIGIIAERNPNSIIGILAIIKAGGAYLPIDPLFPVDRSLGMLQAAEVKLLLCDDIFNTVYDAHFECISFDAGLEQSTKNPVNEATGDSSAYILFTSGSTGQPKGVLIEQHPITRLVKNTNYIKIVPDDHLLLVSNFTFDLTTFDIWGALLNGAALHLCSKEQLLDPVQLRSLIHKHQITVSVFSTNLFHQLVETDVTIFAPIKKIIVAGDRLLSYYTNKLLTAFPNNEIINGYGPTENTTLSTYFSITEQIQGEIPIGKPIANTQIYILDQYLRPQPIGVIGEIYCAGSGLARVYLNDEAQTSQKFITTPADSEIPNLRLYKTGDLGKWDKDGNIYFKGRNDGQVKLRGYRIELGEIENTLLQHENIHEAIVLLLSDKNAEREDYFLCAYYAAKEELDTAELKEYLSQSLPNFMIPTAFVHLPQLPLNKNGKIDKQKLPYPEENKRLFVAPETETELRLALLWQEILGIQAVGKTDDFFELGGHSLKASVMLFRLQEEFGIKIRMGDFFFAPTLEATALLVEKSPVNKNIVINTAPILDSYPLSPAQKRMFILNQFEEAGTSYNMPGYFEINGKLDVEAFENAFQLLVNRHESFRTRFAWVDGAPLQYIEPQIRFEVEQKNCSEEEIERELAAFKRTFDLTKAPLLRVALLKIKPERFVFMFDMHHIISDGISMSILFKEFLALYRGENLNHLSIQYKDYAWWHAEQVQNGTLEQQRNYWLERFSSQQAGTAGELNDVSLPLDFKRPETRNFEGAVFQFQLDHSQLQGIKKIAQQNGTTLYVTLLSAYNILLSKYTGESDIVVGSPASGRPNIAFHEVIGMFVNTLALRNFPESNKSVSEFLAEVKRNTLEALDNDRFQFEELIDALRLKRDLNRNPLFDTMFSLQNIDFRQEKAGELEFKSIARENKVAKFDLFWEVTENQNTLDVTLSYATSLFKPETIARFAASFIRVLEQIVANPALKIGEIDVLSEAEKQQLLVEFNPTEVTFPEQETIFSLFEKQVLATPDNVALVFEDKSLTYNELNALSNQLAHCILEKTAVSSDDTIAILLDRSERMVVSVLAVLKTGGCYVPIDPSYPQERIDFMLSDSGAKLVVDEAFVSRFLTVINTYATEKTGVLRNPHDLAYIIYTSGSTGQPKGVMIEDQQVVRLLFNEANLFDFSSTDVWTLFHSYCFDFSVWEMYGALLFGGKLVVVPKIVAQSTPDFRILVQQQGVTVLNQTPGSFYNFIPEELIQNEALLSLRYVIFGGEALSPAKLAEFKSRYPKTKLINMYGITETTVHVTYKEITETEIEAGISNIGVAIPTLQTYILDANLKLVPIGVAGELCVGGAGLARGYLNREELTAEKFVNHPWIPNEKLYRSGDLARLLPSGELEYLGRIDQQVKIRGFRIELGEVEAKMLALGIFQDVVVIDRKDSDNSKFLVAYFTSTESQNASEIRQQLTGLLPDYMLPSFFVQLESIPLTSNGKVDRKALPEPKNLEQNGTSYLPPRNETEQKLAEIWQEVLGIERVGINDNFFELGGHSLNAMVLVSKIANILGLSISLRSVFENPTIQQLAILGGQAADLESESIHPLDKENYYELSFAQNRLWLMSKIGQSQQAFNLPTSLKINGPLDLGILLKALQLVADKHETLRTHFVEVQGLAMQQIVQQFEVTLEIIQADENFTETELSDWIKAQSREVANTEFDLVKLPLWLMRVLKINDNEHQLLLNFHHIIADGWSIQQFAKDLMLAYGELKQNAGFTLPSLTTQYKDFAAYQNKKIAKNGELAAYWKNKLSGLIPVINLPEAKTRPELKSFNGATYHFSLDEKTTTALLACTKTLKITDFVLVRGLLNFWLYQKTALENLITGTPVAGRSHPETKEIIGYFINTLPLHDVLDWKKTLAELLMDMNQTTLEALEKEEYPLEKMLQDINYQRDASRSPLFDIGISWKNFELAEKSEKLGELQIQSGALYFDFAKYDLWLFGHHNGSTISLMWEYNTDLFEESTIQTYAQEFQTLAQNFPQQMSNKLIELRQINHNFARQESNTDTTDNSFEFNF